MMKTMRQMTRNSSENTLDLVLLAAGSSTRMGAGQKKEYLRLGSGTVLSVSLGVFFDYEKNYGKKFSHIIITAPAGHEDDAKKAVAMDKNVSGEIQSGRLVFMAGGSTRQESVCLALKKLCALENLDEKSDGSGRNPVVLIHDGARPYLTTDIIAGVVDAALEFGAAVPAVPAVDTFKESSGDGTIARHLVRKNLAAVQTPQGFLLGPLMRCHEKAIQMQRDYTDDSEIWDDFPELTGEKRVRITKGDTKNKKITYRDDIPGRDDRMFRIGLGTDLHRLVEGRSLMIGGVNIPSPKGELGHSDGDVLLHAIGDSVLGAAGLGDIGSYFPPEDPQWKDADSALLLKKIWGDVRNRGWELENLDCVLEFESPKFIPWRNRVIESVSKILCVDSGRVFVKAKTNEKLDSVGGGLAIKAYCVCLLKKD